MPIERPFYLRAGVWRLLVWFLFVVLFCLLFKKEISVLIVPALQAVSDKLADYPSLSPIRNVLIDYISKIFVVEVAHSIKVILANAIVFIFFGFFALYFVAQFALPVRSGANRRRAFLQLILYLLGLHGPAILIREGRLVGSKTKLESTRPGVALIDLSSAIVVERQLKRYSDDDDNGVDWQLVTEKKSTYSFLKTFIAFLQGKSRKTITKIRAGGPGLFFTKRGEKIISIVDLRRQSRSGLVEAYTRDGIKVSTKIASTFSLSDEPEVIPVAYLNGNGKENLVGLKLDENEQAKTITVSGYYALNPQDAAEIHNFVEHGQARNASSIYWQVDSRESYKPPYSFYPERVFAAAYSEATTQSSSLTPWHELPVRVAVDHFRKHLEQYSFDDLHLPNDPERFPLIDFKNDFNRKVRNEGVLAYKLVRLVADNPEGSQKWNAYPFDTYSIKRSWRDNELEMSVPRNLTNSKILRDRGIKVISASFSELHIVDDVIRLQMIENWKARWDREIEITRARHELEAIRERNRARVQTQREMTYVLSDLFKKRAHSKEALALRVFQALEAAASSPEPDKKIASAEILSMLNNLHEWLLPEKKDTAEKSTNVRIDVSPNDSNTHQ